MTNTTTQTAEQKKRIASALDETNRFIEKETNRGELNRPADMQKHLDFCIAHRAKLNAMLAA